MCVCVCVHVFMIVDCSFIGSCHSHMLRHVNNYTFTFSSSSGYPLVCVCSWLVYNRLSRTHKLYQSLSIKQLILVRKQLSNVHVNGPHNLFAHIPQIIKRSLQPSDKRSIAPPHQSPTCTDTEWWKTIRTSSAKTKFDKLTHTLLRYIIQRSCTIERPEEV